VLDQAEILTYKIKIDYL